MPTRSGEMPSSVAFTLEADFYQNRFEHALEVLKKNPWLVQARSPENQQTPLHMAATSSGAEGNLRIIRWLIEHGADVNARCYNQFTPLHLAASPAIAKLLLQSGANPNLRAVGYTPLQFAVVQGSQTKGTEGIAVARAILSRGVPLDLQSALWLGERESAKRFIAKYPESVKHPTRMGRLWGDETPLGIAAAQGDKEIVLLLIQSGAPVNHGTGIINQGYVATPLTNAVGGGKAEIVEILCRSGADTNIKLRRVLKSS
jgi:ankyrin repeat protein